jgi:Sensors of blue-light using FAD
MISWTYLSRCVVPKEQQESALEDIVTLSRQKNEVLVVTGCLVFTGVHFAQIIEGQRASVAELQKSIRADKRHADVTTVYEEQIERRRFLEWSLAYAGPSLSVSRTIEETLSKVHERNRLDMEGWVELMERFTSSTRH